MSSMKPSRKRTVKAASPQARQVPDDFAAPVSLTHAPSGYAEWLADVKARIHAAQQRAALAVNRGLLAVYWQLGREILERQQRHGWGAGIVDKVAADLRAAFPAMKGFSRANLMYMRAFAEAWPEADFVQQAVGQLPWGHNLVLLTKFKDRDVRLVYAAHALEHGWSRAVLVHHIEARSVERQGKALTNFTERLPKPQSDLARESLKDPYRFDFLGIGDEASELELEGRRLLGDPQGAGQPRAPHPRRHERPWGTSSPCAPSPSPCRWPRTTAPSAPLIPIENKRNFLDVSADIVEHGDPICYGDAKTAAMKVLGG